METVGYFGYLWVVWRFGEGERYTLRGGWGGVACLFAFALSVMTVSKTLLYCEFPRSAVLGRRGIGADKLSLGANEAFSGFDNIGHNDLLTLIFCWIIPK